jgi:hypothetical protein
MCEWGIQCPPSDVSLLISLHVSILNTISLASAQITKCLEPWITFCRIKTPWYFAMQYFVQELVTLCLDVCTCSASTVNCGSCYRAVEGSREMEQRECQRRQSGTQNITWVFHSNHFKIFARKTFINGILSCQKKRFWIKLFQNCQYILKWCDVQLWKSLAWVSQFRKRWRLV